MAFWDIFKRRKKKTFSVESMAVEKSAPPAGETSAAEKKSETRDEHFMAEHFEGLGDVWQAIFGDDDSIAPRLPTVLEQGKLLEHCQVTYKDKTLVVLFQYPGFGDIRTGALVVQKPDSEQLEFYSCFPVMQGLPNNLKIRKRHTWENGVEDVVAAEGADKGWA